VGRRWRRFGSGCKDAHRESGSGAATLLAWLDTRKQTRDAGRAAWARAMSSTRDENANAMSERDENNFLVPTRCCVTSIKYCELAPARSHTARQGRVRVHVQCRVAAAADADEVPRWRDGNGNGDVPRWRRPASLPPSGRRWRAAINRRPSSEGRPLTHPVVIVAFTPAQSRAVRADWRTVVAYLAYLVVVVV
jgi:hypothetical protein